MSTKKIDISFKPINEKRHYEKIVDLLKQKVFSGEFKPGDRLPPERELSLALNVSRLSVREAYRALEIFGMVEIKRGNEGGAYIRNPHRDSIIQSVSDLFRFQGITIEEWNEARLFLELDIGRLAIKRSKEEDYKRLEDLIADAYKKIEAGIPSHEEHIKFHLAFAELAHNPIIYTAYNSMMDLLLGNLLALKVTVEHAQKATEAHVRIVEALKSKDLDSLLQAIEEHVKGAGLRLLSIAKASPLFNKGQSET
ncbi:MAG: FadR family transcriptional regulator [Syntrophorhabdaceae bacterium]|nr:FadR family transcriptional regulator [Syntrophorhabdaceae bacterium]